MYKIEHKLGIIEQRLNRIESWLEILANAVLKDGIKLDLLKLQNRKIMSVEQEVLDAIAAEKQKIVELKTAIDGFLATHTTPEGGISAEGAAAIKAAIADNSSALDAEKASIPA